MRVFFLFFLLIVSVVCVCVFSNFQLILSFANLSSLALLLQDAPERRTQLVF